MAFVFGKSKKQSPFRVRNDIPGPSQYLIQPQPSQQGTAPFNSSAIKTSTFDVDKTDVGPGSYNVNTSKYKSKSKEISSSFKSKVERFKTQPSPEDNFESSLNAYLMSNKQEKTEDKKNKFSEKNEKMKEKMQILRKNNLQARQQSLSSKQYVRIILSNPKNTQMNHSVYVQRQFIPKQGGVGSYNLTQYSSFNNKNVLDWSKNQSKRFKSAQDINPGPGYYSVQDQGKPKRSSSLSSAFAFQGVRSHMDQIVYRTKMPFKVKVIQEKHLKDRYPGPGSYDPQIKKSKSFHYVSNDFALSQTEYKNNKEEDTPGPGYYNEEIINSHWAKKGTYNRDDIKKTRTKLFIKKQRPQKVPTLEEQNAEEMRNRYIREMEKNQNKFYTLKQRCTSKNGNFSHEQRFKSKEKNKIPGPGEYRYLQSSKKAERQSKSVQAAFNSTVAKLNNEGSTNKPMPFYQVDRYDLGKKAIRVKRNIENLKQIDITKAPFNSKEQRFTNKQVEKQVNKQEADFGYSFKKIPEKRHILDNYERKPNQSSIFVSKSRRMIENNSQSLGPGAYETHQSLLKQSFNQDYNYISPTKIRFTRKNKSSVG